MPHTPTQPLAYRAINFQEMLSVFELICLPLPPYSSNRKLGNCFAMSHLKLAQLEEFKNSQSEEQRCLPETNAVSSSAEPHFEFPQGDTVCEHGPCCLPSPCFLGASVPNPFSLGRLGHPKPFLSGVLSTRGVLLPMPKSLDLHHSLAGV